MITDKESKSIGVIDYLRGLVHELVDEGLHDVSVAPCGRVETEPGASLSVNEELLKVPGDIAGLDGVVHELLAVTELLDGLGARFLEELVKRMMVLAVHVDLSVDMKVLVRLPAITRSYVGDSI